jgi:hypothetical protein
VFDGSVILSSVCRTDLISCFLLLSPPLSFSGNLPILYAEDTLLQASRGTIHPILISACL